MDFGEYVAQTTEEPSISHAKTRVGNAVGE